MWCAISLESADVQTVAGHDALAIQKRIPASLIFVPSQGGHAKQLWLIY